MRLFVALGIAAVGLLLAACAGHEASSQPPALPTTATSSPVPSGPSLSLSCQLGAWSPDEDGQQATVTVTATNVGSAVATIGSYTVNLINGNTIITTGNMPASAGEAYTLAPGATYYVTYTTTALDGGDPNFGSLYPNRCAVTAWNTP